MAQTVVTTGSIRGTVSDSSGAAAPGATIELREERTGTVQKRHSGQDGLFLFPALAVGKYSIQVTLEGFRPAQRPELIVSVGETTSADVTLQAAGATSESITVVGTIPILRTNDSTDSTVMSRSVFDGLPLSGRRYSDFALLTPNASPDGQSGLVSFAGEQGGEDTGYANGNGANAFTVDGANATSTYFGNARGGERLPYVFGENSIEEFQVAVSPYSSAYGGGATGFLNTVTKSGTSEFHGNAFYFNRNSGTGANDAVDKAAGIPRPVDVLQQFGAALGGPIRRQRAWFFFDFEQHREQDPISVINGDYSGLDQTSFGVSADASLPAPNGSFPSPSSLSAPDASNPVYLQQVSNALNAIQTNLGTHSRSRNDLLLFSKLDMQAGANDRIYLSLNLNRFNSPNGEITSTNTPLFGISTLANSFVRDYHAAAGWTHVFTGNLLLETYASFSRDDQYSTPTNLVDPGLPSVILSAPSNFELGNAGFANGRTNEAQWGVASRLQYLHGRHHFQFGVEANRAHITDTSFGGFDPDAQKQNGSLGGTYAFSSLTNFALGIYDSFSQSSGSASFSFNVPFLGFYAQDTWQFREHLTLDLGVREDFQIYPQPKENPAFPLTGQFPNQFQRIAPRLGFAWNPAAKTIVRGGAGLFYENFNGLNYRNSVISNGLSSQQSSVQISYENTTAPNQQAVVFPQTIQDHSLFSVSSISLVDPNLRDPEIFQASLEIEREILPETTFSVGTMWTHGMNLISSSAFDMNLFPPTGTTTYYLCPAGLDPDTQYSAALCSLRTPAMLPNLDSNLLQEGRISSQFQQINALISPGINNYNSLFVQLQRRVHHGLAVEGSYTFAKNIMSRGVDFSNQFDFRNSHAPCLLDQRHRLTLAFVYQPWSGHEFSRRYASALLSNWTLSSIMLFSSGRPYAALLDTACTSSINSLNQCDNLTNFGNANLNDTAANQATANSALGINAGGPSPFVGLNSFYGPWMQQIDLGLGRRIAVGERQSIVFQVQAFNLLNHPNFYVQNGNGVQFIQYDPVGSTCGDGKTLNQQCFMVPNTTFKTLQIINPLNGPRVLQFALKYSF